MTKGQGPRFGRKPEAEAADRAGCPRRYALAAALACLCSFALSSPASSQGDVGGSTVTARVRQDGSPLILTLARDRRDSKISVDYSVRWDFSDLASFRPGLKMLSAGLSALWKW
ncbi:MAG TPA: hypothetical protein PL037_08570, partial [Elusimicrobiales bacterium]|nr:hypothetical protein [Elusimicrobiales bacterium]